MMQELIERIRNGHFWKFPGGIKPPGFKDMSNQHEIERIPLAEKLYIPVKQHVGIPGRILAEPGKRVLKGQPLTHSMNPLSVPVHAPTSGEIIEVVDHVSCHPSGIPEKTIVMAPDGREEWVDLKPVSDYQALNRASLVEVICSAGISGMGGAGFPTHIKLSSGKNIEFLVINGVECEPYITSDDRLMREHAWQIRQGIDVLCHILQPQHVLIAIEDNKPEAIEAMQIAIQDNNNYILCPVETVYPAGGEKQLIQMLTSKEVPSKGLPVDIGVMMQNVGTCFAIADAIFSGKPLLERVVTLAGKAIQHPQNLWLPLGTPVEHAVKHCDYQEKAQKQKRFIMGGPMMGFTLHSPLVPVIKTSNCILVPSDKELPPPGQEIPCIRCGACADACPAGLLPQQLYWHAKGNEFDKAQDLNLFDCIECGACAYVCPSEIPLVHYYRGAKAEIRIQQEDAEKALKAKERFEARNERLERDKQEREEKARIRSKAREDAKARKATSTPVVTEQKPESEAKPASASDRVAAALARAKAKKAAQSAHIKTASSETEAEASVSDAQSSPKEPQGEEAHSPDTDKKAKVAAAIARAKARKEAQQKTQSNEASIEATNGEQASASDSSPEDDKKARVAAAIARAKAKKAAKEDFVSDENATKDTTVENATLDVSLTEKAATENASPEDDKKTKVAAAIARAKAKKAAKESESHAENDEKTSLSNDESKTRDIAEESTQAEFALEDAPPAEDKQAKIAAAVTRAKAKKAAREAQPASTDKEQISQQKEEPK